MTVCRYLFTAKSLGIEDNIKMDIQEVRFWSVDWIYVAQDRDGSRVLVNVVMNV